MTTRQLEYLDYLKSEHWARLRDEVLRRDGYKCTRCPARHRLQAHHKIYRPKWEDSVADDLITLCRSCHEREHGLQPVTKFKGGTITGQIGNRRWNELGQRVSRNGVPYGFKKRKVKLQKKQLSKKQRKIRAKYLPWALQAFRR